MILSLYESRHGIRIFLTGKVNGGSGRRKSLSVDGGDGFGLFALAGLEDAGVAAGKVLQL
jgi:hypothetical protein